MTTPLLHDKEGQLREKLTDINRDVKNLKQQEQSLKHQIMILTRQLYSTQSQVEDLQRSFHSYDRELAFLDGRYQVLKPKKSMTKTCKAKPDQALASMTTGQLSYLKTALEQLMKEEEGG